MAHVNDAVIVIRGAGERTEQACKHLILKQKVSPENVHLIHEVPFSAALRTSYQIGIDSGCKWTLCVDADLLLRPGSIRQILRLADKQPPNVCEIQGFMLDKFFGGIRKGGIHLYRSSLLPLVMEQIPEEGVNIRPETQTLRNMKKLGYSRAVVPYVVGIHDDEQYNKDIYRKAFVHGVKHVERLPLFVAIWKEHLSADPDFEVALAALSESIKTTEQLYINSKQNIYASMFKKAGFTEKKELNPDDISPEFIEEKIENWVNSELYLSFFPTRDGYDSAITGFANKMKRLNKKFGPTTLAKMGLRKIIK